MLYEVAHAVVPPLAKAVWRPRVEGLDNLPPTGPVIVASNHISFADSMVIPIVVPRKVVFLAKEDYFTGTGVKGALMRGWFEGLGMVPVDRDDTRSALASLDVALDVLGRGEAFGIYPEGTRSRDGMLYKGHTGAARLALKVRCPIIPVGIIGTREIQPPDTFMPKIGLECTLRFGRPVTVDRYLDRADDHMVWREMTDEVMFEIRELTGQEYRNVYASKRPETLNAGTAVVSPGAEGARNPTELQSSTP